MGQSGIKENSREKILDIAETFFRENGIHGVSLSDVAAAVGIRKSSLYHHFPGGKADLYVAVQDRMFARMGSALDDYLTDVIESIDEGEELIERGLIAASKWFLDRPPLFILSMLHHDMPEFSDDIRQRLTQSSYFVIMKPIVRLVSLAQQRGDVVPINPHTVAGGFLSILEGTVIAARAGFGTDTHEMMRSSIQMICRGIAAKPSDSDKPLIQA